MTVFPNFDEERAYVVDTYQELGPLNVKKLLEAGKLKMKYPQAGIAHDVVWVDEEWGYNSIYSGQFKDKPIGLGRKIMKHFI